MKEIVFASASHLAALIRQHEVGCLELSDYREDPKAAIVRVELCREIGKSSALRRYSIEEIHDSNSL
jgi:hypothetical protein